MKSNSIRYIDDTTAQVTKAFQRQARIFGTDEYKMWKAYREDFPGARMETKTIKRNPSKRTYRNLTYVNMGRYISVNAPKFLEEFEKQKESAKAQENPYRSVLAWFLTKFPNYDDYKKFFEDTDKTTEDTAAAEQDEAAEISEGPAATAAAAKRDIGLAS